MASCPKYGPNGYAYAHKKIPHPRLLTFEDRTDASPAAINNPEPHKFIWLHFEPNGLRKSNEVIMHQYLHHESHDWSDQDDIDRLNLFRIAALTMIFGKDLDVDGELKCSRYLIVQEIRAWFPDISEVDEEEIHNEGNREEQEEEDEEEEFDRFLYEEMSMQRGAQDVLGEHTSQSERIRMSRSQQLTDAMLLEESFRRLGTYEDYGSSLSANSLDTSSANIPPLNSSSPRVPSVRSSYSRTRRANTRTKNTLPQNDLTSNAVQDFGSWENYEVLNAPSLSNDRSPITSSSDTPPRNFS